MKAASALKLVDFEGRPIGIGIPDRYTPVRRIGNETPGMPQAWLARDERLSRDVVVKQYPPARRAAYERDLTFLRALLPNVPQLIDAMPDGGGGWLVRDYISGTPLDKIGLINSRDALSIAASVAALCHEFHTARPQRMVLNALRLGDLVCDADMRIWLIAGREAHPALEGSNVFAQDILHAGVVAARLLTGFLKGDGKEWRTGLPALEPAVARVLEQATNSDPEVRFASAKWLAQAFQELAELEASPKLPASVPAPAPVFHPVRLAEHPVAHALKTNQTASLDAARRARRAISLRTAARQQTFQALETLDIDVYEHQKEAALQALSSPGMGAGAILADEVGLGKTIEALIICQELRARGLAESVLIVAPPASAPQWLAEIRARVRRNAYERGFRLYTGASDAGYPLLIVSSATIKQERRFAQFGQRKFDLVIVDEAHHCCAGAGGLSPLGESVAKLSRSRLLLLTATPLGNRLWDLYTLSDLIRPGLLGSKSSFAREYLPNVSGDHMPDPHGAIRDLRARARAVMIRHKRSQLRDAVSPKCDYRAARLPEGATQSDRIRAAVDLIHLEWGAERVVAFARQKVLRDALKRELSQRQPDRVVQVFSGNRRDQREYERRFNEFASSVMIAGDTVAEGMNWQRARCMLHLDAPVSPIVWEQRVGRIYRLGQQADCLEIVHLTIKGSGEARAFDLYERDLQLFDLPVGEAASALDHLNDPRNRDLEADIRSLLRDPSHDIEAVALALRTARAAYDRSVQEASWLDMIAFGDEADI